MSYYDHGRAAIQSPYTERSYHLGTKSMPGTIGNLSGASPPNSPQEPASTQHQRAVPAYTSGDPCGPPPPKSPQDSVSARVQHAMPAYTSGDSCPPPPYSPMIPQQTGRTVYQYIAAAYPSPPGEDSYSSTTSKPRTKGVYVCLYPECSTSGRKCEFDRKADLQRHHERYHCPPPQLYDCPYADRDNCSRSGVNGLPRPDKLRDHLHDKHKLSRDAIDKVVGLGRRFISAYDKVEGQ